MSIDIFFDKLTEDARVRVKFGRVREIYLQTYPEDNHRPDLDQQVVQAIQNLVEKGKLVLPSKGRRDNWSGPFHNIPSFVVITSNRLQSKMKTSVRAWHPKVASLVMGDKKISHPEALRRLGQLSSWFAKTEGQQLVNIPLRERALEIFGDEKALDGRKDGVIYKAGRHTLTFDDIAAFYVPPPIPWESPDGSSKELNGLPILFIENSNTYYSFARWNNSQQVYAAVAYAKGNQISASIAQLDWIIDRFPDSPLQYFGDLDREGIAIFQRMNSTLSKNNMPTISPALPLYWYLINNGRGLDYVHGDRVIDEEQMTQEFGPELSTKIRGLFKSGQRIAQESLRFDLLCKIKNVELLNSLN